MDITFLKLFNSPWKLLNLRFQLSHLNPVLYFVIFLYLITNLLMDYDQCCTSDVFIPPTHMAPHHQRRSYRSRRPVTGVLLSDCRNIGHGVLLLRIYQQVQVVVVLGNWSCYLVSSVCQKEHLFFISMKILHWSIVLIILADKWMTQYQQRWQNLLTFCHTFCFVQSVPSLCVTNSLIIHIVILQDHHMHGEPRRTTFSIFTISGFTNSIY